MHTWRNHFKEPTDKSWRIVNDFATAAIFVRTDDLAVLISVDMCHDSRVWLHLEMTKNGKPPSPQEALIAFHDFLPPGFAKEASSDDAYHFWRLA